MRRGVTLPDIVTPSGATPLILAEDGKVAVARNLRDDTWPVNGLRHPPVNDHSGWYLWAGDELSSDPEFFIPLHAAHLREWRPIVLPYLHLPPGWRFLLAPNYEDVWFDESLLHV